MNGTPLSRLVFARPALIALGLVMNALSPGVPAYAHGGDDHGAVPQPPAATDAMRSASATTAQVELVLRWPEQAAATGALPFLALLSDAATNAPLEGATLDAVLAAPGRADARIALVATRSPGVYAGSATLPGDGTWALQLTAVQGSTVASVALPAVEIGAAHDDDHAGHDDHAEAAAAGRDPWTIVGLIGAPLFFLAVFFAFVRKRPRAGAGVVGLLVVLSLPARAHGGEEHEHAGETKAAAPGNPGGAAAKVAAGRIFLAKESQFLLGVRTTVVAEASLAERVTVSGVVSAPPERHAAVFAPQSGRISAPRGGFAQLGARIKRGQLLGVMDAVISAGERASFLSAEAQARADVASFSARLEAARSALARLEALQGVASTQQLEAARVAVITAQAELEGAHARGAAFSTGSGGATARFDLSSPIDGVLADINVSPGAVLGQGERAFLVVDPAELTVEAKVPEHQLARLAGSKEAVVSVDAFTDRSFPARLIAEGQVIDDVTRTVKVVFALPNPDNVLKLGMFARVQIGTGAGPKAALAVPDAAVLDVDGHRIVYVHTAPEEFEAREVQLGRRDGDRVEVLQGLAAGERVVTTGAPSLRGAAR